MSEYDLTRKEATPAEVAAAIERDDVNIPRKLDGRPRKARAQQDCEAWFYIDRRGQINVFICKVPGGPTYSCVIERRQLTNWMNQ